MHLITLRHTPFGMDEGSVRHRELYQTTHNVNKRQTSMPQAGFKPTIPASGRPQSHALDGVSTGIGFRINMDPNFFAYNLR